MSGGYKTPHSNYSTNFICFAQVHDARQWNIMRRCKLVWIQFEVCKVYFFGWQYEKTINIAIYVPSRTRTSVYQAEKGILSCLYVYLNSPVRLACCLLPTILFLFSNITLETDVRQWTRSSMILHILCEAESMKFIPFHTFRLYVLGFTFTAAKTIK